MSDHDETVVDERGAAPVGDRPDTPAPRSSRSSGLWWKILLFAGGVLVGVLGVGLLNATTPDFATAAGPASSETSGQPGGSVPAGVEAQVNAACLGVINEAQDVYAVLGDLGQAVDDVDLTALDDIVRRLQPIEPRLGRDLTGCRVDTTVTSGGTSPAPSFPPTSGPPTSGPPSTTTTVPSTAPPTSPTSPAPQPSVTR